MNIFRWKYVIIALALWLAVLPAAGCSCVVIATSPADNVSPPANVTGPADNISLVPIDESWVPPVSAPAEMALPGIEEVIARVKPSVVAINTEVTVPFFNQQYTQEGAGSGWILDGNGIIVTNYHVVANAGTITVTLDDGSTYTVDRNAVFTDSLNDLAVLKIDAEGLPALAVGDSTALRLGQWVVAIGNSLGMGISATHGIVSQLGVSLQLDMGQTLYDLINTDAAINPGNSGGPLVNMSGEVIGITSAKIASIGVEGMGYAISTHTAMPVIQQLVSKGYVVRPWLGVGLYTVDQLAIYQYDLQTSRGALILEVVAGSPAEQAGLREGDVIVRLAGSDIASMADLTRVLDSVTIGEPVEITYWRGAQTLTVIITPAESPPPSN